MDNIHLPGHLQYQFLNFYIQFYRQVWNLNLKPSQMLDFHENTQDLSSGEWVPAGWAEAERIIELGQDFVEQKYHQG